MRDTNELEILNFIKEKDIVSLREIFEEYNSVDLAEILNELEIKKLLFIFKVIPPHLSAEVFTYLSNDTKEELVKLFKTDELKNLMEELYKDDLADFIEDMPANIVRRILRSIDKEDRSEVNQLLSYKENTAGTLMTIEYIELKASDTCEVALDKIKAKGKDVETIYKSFVVDRKRNLIGYVSLKDILLAKKNELIKDLMDEDVVPVHVNDDQEYVANMFKKYDFNVMPVVNNENKLLGIITVDDIIDVLEEEASEDIAKMSGLTPLEDEYFKTSILRFSKSSITWLVVLMLLSFISGYIINSNSLLLAAIPILTIFVPTLTSSAGNAGSQTTTLVIRAMSLGEITLKDYFKVLLKELSVALVVGTGLAIVSYGWFWAQQGLGILNVVNTDVFLIVSITLIVAVVVAKVIGASLPILAKLIKVDPAFMAGPFVSTIVDALTLTTYFLLASSLI